MYTQNLVLPVAEAAGITPEQARRALLAVFDTIARTVAGGDTVTITNFGSFRPVDRPERPARNLNTGEGMMVPAYRAVSFRPTGRLPQMVREGDISGTTRKLPKGALSGGVW